MIKARTLAVMIFIIILCTAIFMGINSSDDANKSAARGAKIKLKDMPCMAVYAGIIATVDTINDYCSNSEFMPKGYVNDLNEINKSIADKLKPSYGDEKFDAIVQSEDIQKSILKLKQDATQEMEKVWLKEGLKTVSERCNYYSEGAQTRIIKTKEVAIKKCGI